MKVCLSGQVGTEDDFAQDMDEHCYLVKKQMEKREGLMAELGKLAMLAVGQKVVFHYFGFFPSVCEVGPSSVVVVFAPEDGPSRISAGGDFVGSVAGNASSSSVRGFKTAFKVKFGYPGLAFGPKWLSENLQVILSMYCMGKTAKQC
ncbi:hypothetical protein Tco_0850017 [Tanacetum coccineum]